MRRRPLVVVAVLLLATRVASGDPTPTAVPDPIPAPTGVLSMRNPTVLEVPSGKRLTLPAGRFYPDPDFAKLDTELRRLQDAETRLTAENVSLRATASTWQPGWKTIATVLVTGFAGGIVVAHYANKL